MKTKNYLIFTISALLLCISLAGESSAQHKKKQMSEPTVAVTPIYVYAQDREFKAFAGLDLPNQLHVLGTTPKVNDFQGSYTTGVNIVKLEGPGAIGGMDSVWYWNWKPFASDTGKTFRIRYLAGATRHGGAADTMISSFTVKVFPLVPEDTALQYPRDEHNYPTAYTNIPFKVNAKYKELDGDYKIEMHICDATNICELRTTYGPYAELTSKDPKNEGKDIETNTYFRSFQSNVWLPMRTEHARIVPAPLAVAMLAKIDPQKEQTIHVYYGIEGYYMPVRANYLDVQSAGYFEPKALKIPKIKEGSGIQYKDLLTEADEASAAPSYDFLLKPTDKAIRLAGKETSVQVIFIDPATQKQTTKTIILLAPGEAAK